MVLSDFFKNHLRSGRSSRVQDNRESEIHLAIIGNKILKLQFKNSNGKDHLQVQKSSKTMSDFEKKLPNQSILDPGGMFAQRWNMIFFIASMIGLFVDPIFFFLPEARPEICIQFGVTLKVALTVIRSAIDLFYLIHIIIQFRTAYIAPSSCVIGRGELVTDPWKIATRYLRFRFWSDLTAALPLPQVFIWAILPNLDKTSRFRTYLMYILTIQTLQMLHRFSLTYPLSLQLCKASGVITEKPWVGAAYNLLFFLLAAVVSGNCWYILSVQRQKQCWDSVCDQESSSCVHEYFDCNALGDPSRNTWLNSTNITNICNPNNNLYPFGMYSFTVSDNISSGGFSNKYFFCLWWGLRNLSSQGQNLETSLDISENIFAILVAIEGLILFGFIVGNMQKFIKVAIVRIEEWRLKQTDIEKWMHHRQLPKELKQSIHKYYNYKWMATRGVDEEVILNALPINLRRQTKRYLCLNLVRQVPLFDKLDDQTLDAICERLKPTLYTQGMHLICEGEPVDEMFFIMRGHLYSYTTDGGRKGFFNSTKLGPNDFCGEELLMWALDRRHTDILPSSTRTVEALSNVEGFALKAEELHYITTQFKRMHSKEVRDKLRFYSQPWRTWAACFIQAAWHRHKRRKIRREEVIQDDDHNKEKEEDQNGYLSCNFPSIGYQDMDVFVPRPDAGIEVYAARLLADKRRTSSNRFG